MFAKALSSVGRLIGLGREAALEGGDRRAWGRLPCAVDTTCQPANVVGAGPLPARVVNISYGGVGLVVGRAFQAGELLSLDLPAGEGEGQRSTVLVCVVRAARAEGGAWELGCTFPAELSDADLRCFGARRARPAPPDQRTWVRYPVEARAAFRRVRSPESASQPAQVLDLSANGAALEVSAPLAVGELLQLELDGARGRGALTTLASVVRVTVRGGPGRVVGCNFIRELSENDLSALFYIE